VVESIIMMFELDYKGFPIMRGEQKGLFFGKAPSVGVARQDADTKSGNPHHDVHSGKFGEGQSKSKKKSSVPAGQDAEAFLRRRDTLRDAARQSTGMTAGDLEKFLKGRVNRAPSVQELNDMLIEVRQERINDLVDILDAGSNAAVGLKAGKSYIKAVINGLGDEELLQLARRLQYKGWDGDKIDRFVLSRIADSERRDSLANQIGQSLSET
jgi:hypothetical protein